jgi:hypothetical protein
LKVAAANAYDNASNFAELGAVRTPGSHSIRPRNRIFGI